MRFLKNSKGSIVIVFMFAAPFLVLLLVLLVDLGLVCVARARLDMAADRAAFAGASVFSHAMDQIAAANWKINKAWRDLKKDFEEDSQQNKDAAKQRFGIYESERDDAFEKIKSIQDEMSYYARDLALDTLRANAPNASGEVSIRNEVFISGDIDLKAQHDDPAYGYVTGVNFIDPESYESGNFHALKFLIKEPRPDLGLGVFATEIVKPVFIRPIIGADFKIKSSAAAIAFGGSIKEFALKETGTLKEAEAVVAPTGFDGLYRTTLVPVWLFDGQ